MIDIREHFQNRLDEIESYFQLLDSLDRQIQTQGSPSIGDNAEQITNQQQRILYSSVYLQLYNLVESTITVCTRAVSQAIKETELKPENLTPELLKEWLRGIIKANSNENCIKSTLDICHHLITQKSIDKFSIELGMGGNWYDVEIYKLTQRIGLDLNVGSDINCRVKRPFRDGEGALQLIKTLRNNLAHGDMSFSECGENVTVNELKELKDVTVSYLSVVVERFSTYINEQKFLKAD